MAGWAPPCSVSAGNPVWDAKMNRSALTCSRDWDYRVESPDVGPEDFGRGYDRIDRLSFVACIPYRHIADKWTLYSLGSESEHREPSG